MSWPLYVKNIPAEITLESLTIYFQSSKSGGGDVDFDSCKSQDGGKAIVVFERKERELFNYIIKFKLSPSVYKFSHEKIT